MRPMFLISTSLLFLGGTIGLPQNKTAEPDVKVIKYDALKDAVLKNRGKVVLVDIWFTL